MIEFTTRIIKGGALLAETRRLIDVWDEFETVAENLDRIRAGNLLGLPSRKRTEDALQMLRQRFIDPDPPILSALRSLSRSSGAFRDACYFEATRNDALLGFAAERVLFEWWEMGRSAITAEQLEGALLETSPDPALKAWGEVTRRRVVRGLLSAYRDFRILEGKARKQLAPPHLTFPGFVYTAGRLRQMGAIDLPTSGVWHRWLLNEQRVRALFLEADRVGILRYADAGTVTRIEWRYDAFEELINAAL